jgi:hypothetical protein
MGGACPGRRRGNAMSEEKIMQANVGSIDRALRIMLGLALITATLTGAIGPWGWVGLVALATGLFGFCPLYVPFGLRTCAVKTVKK